VDVNLNKLGLRNNYSPLLHLCELYMVRLAAPGWMPGWAGPLGCFLGHFFCLQYLPGCGLSPKAFFLLSDNFFPNTCFVKLFLFIDVSKSWSDKYYMVMNRLV
jgi:hypothetical protein